MPKSKGFQLPTFNAFRAVYNRQPSLLELSATHTVLNEMRLRSTEVLDSMTFIQGHPNIADHNKPKIKTIILDLADHQNINLQPSIADTATESRRRILIANNLKRLARAASNTIITRKNNDH